MPGKLAIGVDVGGTKILAGVVTPEGEIIRRHERATPHDAQASVVRELEAAVAELLTDEIAAIAFGVPSPIDLAKGVVVECVNLPLADFALVEHMSQRFGLPVGLDNDANAAAIGEWHAGVARGHDDVVMLTLGTGLGGGFGVAGWEHLIPSAEQVMRREALRPMRDTVQVAKAELGTSAGLIGAGFVAFEVSAG